MTLPVYIHELAEAELNDSADFYEKEVCGLGQAFLTEVERTMRHIQKYPEASPLIYKIIRKKVMDRFPYCFMYSYVNNEIRILAIANQKRHPLY